MITFSNSLIKWGYHCWFISFKMWLIVSQSKGLVHWFFHFVWTFSTTMIRTTTLNNNWRVVQWKHDLLGNSTKYPYHTMDGFLEFQGQGGFFELEIRRHGGITHFGNSEGKGRLKYGSCPKYGLDIFWNLPLYPHLKRQHFLIWYKIATCISFYESNS